MALSACGLREPARRAYRWLRETQRADGSWARSVESGRVTDPAAESHHAAYVAVGAWHEYLVTGDERHALTMWPTVRRAVEWALGLRTPRGEVLWERDAAGLPGTYALLSGCASIHQSLRCAVALAKLADDPRPDWELAADQLGHLVARHPEAFADKSRFAMDWYYPVLGGAVRGEDADRRLAAGWDTFVVPGLGRPVRERRAVGHRGRDLRAGHRAGRLRDARPGAGGVRERAAPAPRRTAPTGPAGSSPTRRRSRGSDRAGPRPRWCWRRTRWPASAAARGSSGTPPTRRASPGTAPRAAASRLAAPREPNGPGDQPMPSPVRSSRRSEPVPGISVNAPDFSARW